MKRFVIMVASAACQPSSGEPDRQFLVESGRVTCARPAERDSLGPVFLASLGEDWTRQRPDGVEESDYRRGDAIGLGDLDGDGRLDLVLSDRSGVQIFLQQEDCRLSRAAEPFTASLADHQPAAVSLLDLDEDGWLDLYVGYSEADNGMYRNLQGLGLEDITEERGLGGADLKPRAFTWGDPDGDGDQDLFVANDRLNSQPPEAGLDNSWLENRGVDGFEDVTERLTAEVLDGYTKNVAWLDLDADGDQDLYVLNHMPFYSGNFLLRNDGTGALSNWEDTGLDLTMSSMGLDVADLNGDGRMDLAIAGVMEIAVLLSTEGPSWVRADTALGIEFDGKERVTAWSTTLADLNNDGRLDLLATMGPSDPGEDPGFVDPEEQPDGLWIQQADGRFSQQAEAWELDQRTANRVAAVVDFNGDGWLDVIKSTRKGRTDIWLARCGEAAWAQVSLRGPSGNPHGLGAKITVQAGGQVHTRWMTSGAPGYLVSAPYRVHFGLGDVDVIDSLQVEWSDGHRQSWHDLEARQQLTALHPDSELQP